MKTLLFFFTALVSAVNLYGQSSGKLTGIVKDRNTQAPLQGIVVALDGTAYGTTSDSDGSFVIPAIPVGSYNVKTQAIGYDVLTIYNVVISSGNVQPLTLELQESKQALQEVVVKVSPFQKSSETPLSIQSLSAQEIKSNPGGNFDVSRVIQAFPGVGGTSGSVGGYRNDLIIRGGAPNENVYYLDGIEVPVINHFATQGSAGGPTGIVNVSFIEDVTLYTTAFPARYDNALSGVLQLKQRKANAERIQHNLRLSATELAYTADGPINNKLSFLASGRRSYLQLLFKALQIPIQPSYWDFQYKLDYKISKDLSFYTIGIGAIDNFSFLTPDEQTPENIYILKSNPLINQWSYTNGYGLKKLTANGFWNLTFSRNMLNNRLDRFEDNQNPVESQRILKIRSTEAENKLRFDWNSFFGRWSLSWGAMLQYGNFENEAFYRIRAELIDSTGQVVQPALTANSKVSLNLWRYGLFAQSSGRFFADRLTLSAGLRADGNSFTTQGNEIYRNLSPRLAASLRLLPQLSFNASAARYFKIPPYTILAYQLAGNYVNQNLEYIQSDHLVAGFEYLPWEAARITLEGFYKHYDNYPVSAADGISLANKGGDFMVLGNEPVTGNGKGESMGLEFQFQQKLTKNFFAILSYTFYKSEFTNADRKFYPASWDNGHLLSFIGGYKLPRNYELGVKFRYQGGAPYTPFDQNASRLNYLTTGTGIYDNSQFNTLRLGSFHSMDIRIDKKWNFPKWTLDLYVDITNAYGSVQPEYPKYTFARTSDNTAFSTTDGQPIQQDGSNAVPLILDSGDAVVIPTIGFILEF